MQKPLLAAHMARHEDTQASLAKALGLSLSRLNAKLNGARGATFNQSEIAQIIQRYDLPHEDACEIFFNTKEDKTP